MARNGDGRWPELILIGAAKAGTTSLHRYLAQHPEIYMYPEKEARFFAQALDEADDVEAAKADYRRLFPSKDEAPVAGETTPAYLWHPEAARRIAEMVPDPRLVVSLRDPIERAYSAYRMGVRQDRIDASFAEVIDREIEQGLDHRPPGVLGVGLYHTHLSRYLEHVDRDRLLVLLFEEFKADTPGVLREIAAFAGADPGGVDAIDHEQRHNPHRVPRNPVAAWLRRSPVVQDAARAVLPKAVRIRLGEEVLMEPTEKPPMPTEPAERLVDVFEPEIAGLEDLLDRELPELRVSWP